MLAKIPLPRRQNGHRQQAGPAGYNDTYASFVGFLPSNDPVAAILVVLDAPRGNNGHFGGPVSAPIFRRIAEETLRYLRVPPSINPETPVLVTRNESEPAHPAKVTVPAPELPIDEEPGTVPDVRVLSARDAMRKLTRFGLSRACRATASPEQDPPPGTPVDEGSVCHLTLARVPVRQTPVPRTQ